jgi:hypothetical protein
MLLDDDELTEAQQLQIQKCASFAALTAEKIRTAENCLFSLLPHEELARLTASWYEASAQAMLHCNYAPIDKWIQSQSRLAAEEDFALEDVLELLRTCRRSAIEGEGWNENVFSVVDDAINEALAAIRTKVSWNIPNSLDYLSELASEIEASPLGQALETEERAGERREFGRNRLRLPIRVRVTCDRRLLEEVTYTQNVSRIGLYFVTRETYQAGLALKVTYPYWTQPGAINREYDAKIVRLDHLLDRACGVAIEFMESLGLKSKTD